MTINIPDEAAARAAFAAHKADALAKGETRSPAVSRERDTGVPEGIPDEPVRVRLDSSEMKFGECDFCYQRSNLGRDARGDLMCGSCADANYLGEMTAYARQLRAMLSAAPQPPTVSTQEWHPIETGIAELADDTLVIVGCTQGVLDIWCGRYLREEKDKQDRGVYRCAPHLDWFPTHWMPRPAAPASVSDKTEAV